MGKYVYIVYEAQERGEDKLVSAHKKNTTALYTVVQLNRECNPEDIPGHDNFYITREVLEE